MNEMTSMYAKLKEMSLRAKTPDVDTEGYMLPKTFQDFYKICPPPRPVVLTDSTPVSSPTNDWNTTLAGYLPMHNNHSNGDICGKYFKTRTD